jgi:predicted  nucleic acid-binding Zn-ribbon protein
VFDLLHADWHQKVSSTEVSSAHLIYKKTESSKLMEITLPKEITERSQQITVASNHFIPEKNQVERLQSQVINLKQENKKLRDQLKKLNGQINQKTQENILRKPKAEKMPRN